MANVYSDSVPGETNVVFLGGNRIHYVSLGKAKQAIVFIHGWACNLGFWCEQVSALSDRARLIFIDLPGHGRSDKPQIEYTLDLFAEAVLTVLADAQVDEAVFMCHSMGGAVLSRLHGRAPEKVAAIIAVDGLLRRPWGTRRQLEELLAPFGTTAYLGHAEKIVDGFFPIPGTEAIRERVKAEMLATPQHVMASAMRALFVPNGTDWALKQVDVPVLAINAPGFLWRNGFDDYIHSISATSECYTMPGVGHFPMLEKPEEFNAMVSVMLEKFCPTLQEG